MQQVVRALRDILNERSQAVMKKADKMQYTRMGKRAADKRAVDKRAVGKRALDKRAVDKREMDKREGLEKMQYTRMGKRSGDFVDETDDLDDLEQEVMNWGLMGKRGDVVDKLRFTRMGKRGATKQFTSRMGKRSTNEKLKYTRMGKRDTGTTEDFSG